MRRRLASARDRFTRFLRESAWAPLAGRAVAIATGMAVLAAIGAGSLDRELDLGPPRAEAASWPRRGAARPPRGREPAAPASAATASAAAASPASASTSAAPPPAPDAAEPRPATTTADGKVILNVAGERDLDRLPGVGPARARAIVALREKLGGKFKRFEDLLRVRGIGRRSLERIRAHAVLDPPPAEEIAPPAG